MGIPERSRAPLGAPAFDMDQKFTSTAACIINRLVKLTSGGGVRPTTGSSGRVALGVALAAATAAGRVIPIRLGGIVDIEASTKAIKRGDILRGTSGAASTASRLGGTVRTTTDNVQNIVGQALSSAAAGA